MSEGIRVVILTVKCEEEGEVKKTGAEKLRDARVQVVSDLQICESDWCL